MGARSLARRPTTAAWRTRTLWREGDRPSAHALACNVKYKTLHHRVISPGTHGSHDGHDAVCDTGTRRDAESLRHLFAAFSLMKPEGLGMGLAVSRSIIEAHGRRLWTTRKSPPGTIWQCTRWADGRRGS